VKTLGKMLLTAAAIFGAAAGWRKFRHFADPDPSVYGHPKMPRRAGP
jgi:hypothetical protein